LGLPDFAQNSQILRNAGNSRVDFQLMCENFFGFPEENKRRETINKSGMLEFLSSMCVQVFHYCRRALEKSTPSVAKSLAYGYTLNNKSTASIKQIFNILRGEKCALVREITAYCSRDCF